MPQAAETIRDNIVKIVDINSVLFGTGFFIKPEYCLTCHHNISQLEAIFVEKGGKKYEARWVEEYSNMNQDIATLRVKNCNIQSLEYAREARPKLAVDVWGYSISDYNTFPGGKNVGGHLGKNADVNPLERRDEVGLQEMERSTTNQCGCL
jgi:hypothetical protein